MENNLFTEVKFYLEKLILKWIGSDTVHHGELDSLYRQQPCIPAQQLLLYITFSRYSVSQPHPPYLSQLMLAHVHSGTICLKGVFNTLSRRSLVQRIAHALIFYPYRCKKNSTLTTGERTSKRTVMFLQVIQKIHPRQVSDCLDITTASGYRWCTIL